MNAVEVGSVEEMKELVEEMEKLAAFFSEPACDHSIYWTSNATMGPPPVGLTCRCGMYTVDSDGVLRETK